MSHPPFHTLYRRYYRLVWWVVRGAGVPEAWAEDVVHDAFLAIHRRLPELDDPERLRPWVIGLARNAAFSHRRGAARRSARQQVAAEPEPPTAVDSAVAYRQAWERLRRFLAELDDEQREAFVLCELQGVAPAEVADALRISRNTVYSRLRLARTKLADHFSERSPTQLPGLVEAARRQGQPPREQQQRTWALLAAQLPLASSGAAGLSTTTTATATTGWLATGKAVLISVSLAAATLGALAAVGRTGTHSSVGREASASNERTPTERDASPSSEPTPRSSLVGTPVGEPASATRPVAGPAPAAPAEPIAAPTPVDPAAASDSASRDASEREATASRRSASEPALAPGLDDDVELLKQAALQLERGAPLASLAILDRHAAAHPTSALTPERLGLRVRALCASGRVAEAERLAARHVAEHPGSPLALKLGTRPCEGT